MKSGRGCLLVLVSVFAISALMVAQQEPVLSPPGEASVQFADGKSITVKYSRPSMRGRKIFGDLVPYGQVWRTGANSATSFTTDTNLEVGGTAVPAGSYTLYTIPGESSWQLVINKQTGQWGTKYDQSQDLARIPMKVGKLPSAVDTFTISFDKSGARGAALKLEWETTLASVAIIER